MPRSFLKPSLPHRPATRRRPWLAAGLLLAGAVAGHASAQTGHDSASARAQRIATQVCATCHGPQGQNADLTFPRLAGQNAEYLAKQLAAFQRDRRVSSAMAHSTTPLTPDEMLALGQFYQRQPTGRTPATQLQLAARGQYLYHVGNPATGVPACASCHGPQALGQANLPRLAGQSPAYLREQLRQFAQGGRTNDQGQMHATTRAMTDDEMAAVAEYLGSR